MGQRRNPWHDPEYRAKTTAAMKGAHGKYIGLDQRALINFNGLHNRIRDKFCPPETDFPRTRDGYIAFMQEMGPKPDDGQKWSVGRKDHDQGYIKGNIEWQTHLENTKEAYGRNSGKVNAALKNRRAMAALRAV